MGSPGRRANDGALPSLRPELNFRDLGGARTGDDRVVKRGLVFRSAHLHDVTEAERAVLLSLGIKTVCDLRHADEAAVRPGPFVGAPGVEILPLGIIGTRATGDPVKTIVEFGITEITEDDLVNVYERFVEDHATIFGRILEVCADADRHSVLVHCSAGKDRTGLAAALLLTALGVDPDAVVADYERSSLDWAPAQIARARAMLPEHGVDPEPLVTYFLAPAGAIRRTLATVCSRYGSVGEYLESTCGVAGETLDRLRDLLLTSDP